MLKVENISKIEIHTDEWRIARLAKFTSSMAYTIMGEKPLTVGALTYIHERVGEDLSGVPAKYEVDTAETRHGLFYEPEAIKKFGEWLGVPFLITQKFITAPNSRFSSTPDVIIPVQKYSDGWDVMTGEIKCYPAYGHFIDCALCQTPAELYKVDKKLYWQVIDQMDNTGALKGYAVIYHPEFRSGGFRVIQFRKIELAQEFKLLKERKDLAEKKFHEVRGRLINLQNINPPKLSCV